MVSFLAVIVIKFLWETVKEFPRRRSIVSSHTLLPISVTSVSAGALSAYFVNIYLGLGPVVAASLVGLTAAAIAKNYAVEIYCGAFVGMVSPDVFHDFVHTVLAAVIAGTIFYLSKDVFKGYGGKLGSIAFSSWVIVSASSRCRLINELVEFRHFGLSIMSFSLISVILTYFLSVRLKNGPVLASSLVSLLGGLLLPPWEPRMRLSSWPS